MTSHAVGQLLLGLAIIMVLARALGTLARKLGQPPVVGEIIAGILLGPSIFGTLVSDRFFPADIRPALAGLANVGLVLFMFIVGYELDQTLIRGRQRIAVSVSIGSILAPLGLGVTLALWLAGRHHVTDVLPFALFIGAAMAVTAFPVLARIVADRGLIRTEVGGLALASAAVDDVIAWSLLAVVVAVGTADGGLPWQVLGILPFLIVMFRWVRPALRKLATARERAGRLTPDVLAVILVGLLISCYLTEIMGLHAIFGAFVFGTVMPRAGGEALRHEILERLEQVSVLLLLPVFFVVAGLQVDLSTVGGAALPELGLILLVAIAGKFLGAYAGARLNKVGARQAGALATLMNTRGLTEIVILSVGLQLAIIDRQIFSMMVVMALVTTIMAGPLLTLIYPARTAARDVALASQAALGETAGYRVLAVVPGEAVAATAVADLAVTLTGSRRPATVALARLVPYPKKALEIGSGLTAGLLEMNLAMRDLTRLAERAGSGLAERAGDGLAERAGDGLAEQARNGRAEQAADGLAEQAESGPTERARNGRAEQAGDGLAERARGGLAVPVLARFTSDPARELAELVRSGTPDLVVTGADRDDVGAAVTVVSLVGSPPEPVCAIIARFTGDAQAHAVLRTAAQLATARGVALVVEAGPRAVAAAVRELQRHGVVVRQSTVDGGTGAAMVVAAERSEGVHVVVRGGTDEVAETPAQWVPRFRSPAEVLPEQEATQVTRA